MSNAFLATDETRMEHGFNNRELLLWNLCSIPVQPVANNYVA
jgi:hypothetical protein